MRLNYAANARKAMQSAYIPGIRARKRHWAQTMFQRLRSRESPRGNIRRLYGAIVARARAPAFYADYGVPDTVAGRFDMVVLHVYLVFRRLAQAGESAAALGQEVFDLFIEDMDASMRELGVGDLSVPRKVRAMAESYYGRAAAYDAALIEAEDGKLAEALLRNVFAGNRKAKAGAERLARYARLAAERLGAASNDTMAAGVFAFPEPGEVHA
jgi:cytochrome b pre-mRNA-processing protein 3